MLEHLLERGNSVSLAMELIYNLLETDTVIENEIFYFNPFSDDEDMPSFWLKTHNYQVAWYLDNPTRGASCNFDPDVFTALFILDKVVRWHNDTGGEEKAS